MLKVLAAVEAYLTALRDIRATGSAQPETSLYPALRDLLNDVAKASGLKQLCIMQMANQGAGFPDGGIFSPSQYRRRDESEPLLGQVPEHGVIEAKKVADDAWLTADTRQVSRYWDRYRMVLVTNFRDFLLLGEDANGQPAKLESFRFAESAATFWQQGQHPRKLAQEKGEQFTEFLLYAMLNRAKLADPADVAQALAHYARDARFRVEHKDAPGLLPFRTALEEALGLKFEGEKGDHFFRATLVQTLFYGIFSAWVLWHREKPGRTDEFDWKNAAYYLRLPMLAALFEQVSTASKLRELELIEVLDRAGAVLNRVVRADFFSKFDEGLAVLYFYEPFLKAYDPDLRKALGVWFTPPEIVKYMVARVDHALRTELGIEDGLADERVYVLDPACGTGAYLVEVVDRIAQNVRQNKGEGLIASEVKRALKERVFGFEILPAPFVVSHLQLGLALKRHGATFGPRERAGVYLTNALTGWEPPDGAAKERIHQMDAFPELKAERDAAYDVKREKPILVVLGNPPYNAFAGASPEEEHGMVDAYKEGLVKEWGIKKFNLDDLYVRFFRLAEHRIGDMTGRGVVCYISNHSWVSDPSFVILRRRLLAGFDNFWIENTHGNRKISEYAPDGRTSETVFAIPGFSAGIQQGVAISLWVKNGDNSNPDAHVRFRDDIDDAKATDRRAHLVATLSEPDFDSHYSLANPGPANRYSFRPSRVSRDYESWPLVVSLSDAAQYQGLSEDRRKALIGCDRRALEERMRLYHSRDTRWTELKDAGGPLTSSYVDFPAEEVRANVLALSDYDPDNLLRYWLRPFDTQYCYYSAVRPLWRRHRPGFHAQLAVTDQFITTRFKQAQSPEGAPLGYVRGLCDYHYLTPNVTAFPVVALEVGQADYRKAHPGQLTSLESSCPRANLSDAARVYLKSLGVPVLNCEADASGLVWMHVLAMGYSRAYIEENADGMSQDWPRIPLPDKRVLLEASAALGREVASLLDTESELRGVTTGRIRPELAAIARPSKDGGGSLDPDADFAVTVGWGHAGKEGVTMPGKGDARERDYLPDEKKAIVEAAERVGLSQKEAFARLGKTTFDIYLNGAAFWKNVPKGVWEYYIGGYQVIKKWLSYRERELLKRDLRPEEARYVSEMVRRIAAILLLQPALDENYKAVKAHTYSWPKKAAGHEG